jgi:hypothetical protein
MNESLIHALISHDLCQQPVSKAPYLLNFQQAWGSVLVVVRTTRMGLPSHWFFKGFKIPFWKKPTTADHYKDPNPVTWRPFLREVNKDLIQPCSTASRATPLPHTTCRLQLCACIGVLDPSTLQSLLQVLSSCQLSKSSQD